jgi:hypothetical protein
MIDKTINPRMLPVEQTTSGYNHQLDWRPNLKTCMSHWYGYMHPNSRLVKDEGYTDILLSDRLGRGRRKYRVIPESIGDRDTLSTIWTRAEQYLLDLDSLQSWGVFRVTSKYIIAYAPRMLRMDLDRYDRKACIDEVIYDDGYYLVIAHHGTIFDTVKEVPVRNWWYGLSAWLGITSD